VGWQSVTPRGRCGPRENEGPGALRRAPRSRRHPYELYLAIIQIEHRRIEPPHQRAKR